MEDPLMKQKKEDQIKTCHFVSHAETAL